MSALAVRVAVRGVSLWANKLLTVSCCVYDWNRYIESVKQCIFIHPQTGTACIIGKVADNEFDVGFR